ncbi:MAG TPA: ABC transporter ATP-binding protein, partial [Planctomycetaceae bacterium]|nr:ABC transporter ATP-binding protein [Planctomycetaceae bacterium]
MNERTADNEYVIELRNVSRQFGTQQVLRDVSFGVR